MKICYKCKTHKSIIEFYPSMRKSRKGFCKSCAAEYQRNWRKNNRERWRNTVRKSHQRNPKTRLLYHAKKRAAIRNIPFALTLSDFEIPEYCPVLGLKLEPGEGKARDTSPSLDRIIPEFGYVPKNVRVMSWRANRLKSDGTADEHDKIASFMREKS